MDRGRRSEDIRSAVTRALQHVVPAGVEYEVGEIVTLAVPDASRETDRTVTRIEVVTDDRPAVVGQYLPFTSGHGRGYHENYVFGFVHADCLARGYDLWQETQLVLDVRGTTSDPPSYRYLTVEEALSRRLFMPDSAVAALIRRYELRYVPVAGGTLAGPSPAMAEQVAELVTSRAVHSVLDVFCGSCALTRAARECGASEVRAVDSALNRDVAYANLGSYVEGCELVSGSALDAAANHDLYDLVVLDPFYDHTIAAVQEVAPVLAGRWRVAVINLGPAIQTEWARRVRRAVEDAVGPIHVIERLGECIAVAKAETN